MGCILKQPDSWKAFPPAFESALRALHPLRVSCSPDHSGLRPDSVDRSSVSLRHRSLAPQTGAGIRRWALPASLAATEGILVSFFSLRLVICLNPAGNLIRSEVWNRERHVERDRSHSGDPGSLLPRRSPKNRVAGGKGWPTMRLRERRREDERPRDWVDRLCPAEAPRPFRGVGRWTAPRAHTSTPRWHVARPTNPRLPIEPARRVSPAPTSQNSI